VNPWPRRRPAPSSRPATERVARGQASRISARTTSEADLLGRPPHADVVGAHVGTNRRNTFGARDVHQPPEQLRPDAVALARVGDEHSDLGVVGPEDAREPADADDLGLAGLGVRALGDEGQLPVVVEEADPDQALVGGPLVEAEVLAVALEDRLCRQRAMELDDERLIFGPDRPHPVDLAVGAGPGAGVPAWIGADGQARQVLDVRCRIVEDDPRVERDQALRRGEQRVDVELADPALLDDELAEADEELLQLVQVHALAAADPLESPIDRRVLHHPPSERGGERREPEGAVAEDLDELAAHPEEEDWPELGIDRAAEDELVAGPVHHRLDRDALKVLGAHALRHRHPDGLVGVPHRGRVLEVELDATHVGLVGDGVGVELDNDRIADPISGGDGLLDRRGDHRLRDRDAVGRQELLRLVLGQERPALGPDGRDQGLGLGPVDRKILVGGERGRLVDLAQVAVETPRGVEDPHGVVGVVERRDPRLAEDRRTLGDVRPAHPAGKDRLAFGLREADELAGGRRRIGHRLGRQDHEEPVAALVAGGRLERLRVSLGGGVADDVDRVVVAPRPGEERVELLHGGRRDVGELAAAGDQGVRRENPGTAGVRDDRQALPGRAGLLGQEVGDVEEVGDRVDAQDADPPERGGQDLVGAREGAGVRSRCLGGLGGPAGLDDDDRLGQGHLAGGREEGPGVPDRLHVDDDALGRRVVAEVGDQVAPAHVEHGAERHDGAEADLLADAPVEDRGQQRAALAHEADGPGRGDPRRERGVEPVRGTHDAEAVRPNDPHAVRPRRREDPALQLGALRADLLEPGGDDDHGLDPGRGALLDGRRHRRGRGHDDDEPGGLGQRGEVRVRPDAEDAGALLVDRVDRAAEGAADQVPEDRPTDAARLLGRPDDGDRGGREERVERVVADAEDVGLEVADRPVGRWGRLGPAGLGSEGCEVDGGEIGHGFELLGQRPPRGGR
jgi:hypothetical protein